MFFTKYDQLSEEIVNQALEENACPQNSEGSAFLEGLSFTARLDGEFAPEELRYEFLEEKKLRVILNGDEYEVPYGAVEQNSILIVSHEIPKMHSCFHLVINKDTYAMTVFETWFGISVPVGGDLFGKRPPAYYRDIPREVQREYYFGWADTGSNEKPEELPTRTNHIEGRGLHWQFDHGFECLTFNPSVVCTTIVELGGQMGGITMSNPADFIMIDDIHYIYARWEVQFSGKMWLEVLDFFEMKAIGLELGFEENNDLTYRFHKADVESTGVLAHLETITENGDKEQPFLRMKPKKGARYAYRPSDIDLPMTREEALKEASGLQHVFEPEGSIMGSQFHMKTTGKLRGRTFKILHDCERYQAAPWSGKDNTYYEYQILTDEKLRWRTESTDWTEDEYRAFEPDKNLFFFAHYMKGDPDFAFAGQIVDFTTGLTTTVRTGIGNWRSDWECGAHVDFGTLIAEGVTPPFTRRHHFTDELVGRCFAWAYGESTASIHMYSAPESYSWTIFQPNNSGGATWSSPGFFIKIRPDVYLLQWVEETCNGNTGLLILNRKIQHDAGFFYGVNRGSGVRLTVTGAYMRELGGLDIRKYYDLRPENK